MTDRATVARRRVMRTNVLALLVCAVASACSTSPSATTTAIPSSEAIAPLQPGEFALTTHAPFDTPPGVPLACGGVGMDATLHGDPGDPRVAWLVNDIPGGHQRVEVAWPPGFRARFSPRLEILDGSGRVKLREGDHIDGNCGTTKEGVILGLSFGLE